MTNFWLVRMRATLWPVTLCSSRASVHRLERHPATVDQCLGQWRETRGVRVERLVALGMQIVERRDGLGHEVGGITRGLRPRDDGFPNLVQRVPFE